MHPFTILVQTVQQSYDFGQPRALKGATLAPFAGSQSAGAAQAGAAQAGTAPTWRAPTWRAPKLVRSIYTNSRSTALAALTFEGVCLSYCRHPCSGACFQAPSGRRLTPFTGITGCTGCAGQAGISRFPVRGGRAAPPTQEKGMWVLYHACARKWPAAPRPRALNLHTHPRPCAKVARVSEFPTPVRKSILCNSHSHSDQF